MDGSCLAAILKIAVLFSLFGREFSGIETYASAIGISLLCGVVMSGIPGGGFLGEALIVSLYGFLLAALLIISAIYMRALDSLPETANGWLRFWKVNPNVVPITHSTFDTSDTVIVIITKVIHCGPLYSTGF
jgi:ABC-type transport system involved in multi-copper enzyme maturation permease subunit